MTTRAAKRGIPAGVGGLTKLGTTPAGGASPGVLFRIASIVTSEMQSRDRDVGVVGEIVVALACIQKRE